MTISSQELFCVRLLNAYIMKLTWATQILMMHFLLPEHSASPCLSTVCSAIFKHNVDLRGYKNLLCLLPQNHKFFKSDSLRGLYDVLDTAGGPCKTRVIQTNGSLLQICLVEEMCAITFPINQDF